MKLHICCGTVYLEGYLNVDIQGTIVDGVKPDATTFDKYYKYPLGEKPKELRGNFKVDSNFDLLEGWPWNDVEEIVMIQAIEHFLPGEAEFMISEVHRVLMHGGKFVFDFPDIVKTVGVYGTTDFAMMNRLIYCNHKDQYSVHKCAYNEKTFFDLLCNNGRDWFDIEFKEVVAHDYPTIGGVATK